MLNYRKIEAADNAPLAALIRSNLEKFHLNIPGTVYFDPGLDRLSEFYAADPQKRAYFTALDENGQVIGGVGAAEFPGLPDCAELQKLYLADSAKGRGTAGSLSGWRRAGRVPPATAGFIWRPIRISGRL